eukprot:GDKI01006222.1.p2 GENE.GDKI01006222.1~~GDKI01006222.1.p2  ORF type:complete len:153 (-),score=43.34 GDKI01006222.1:280-738(-)
MSTRHVQTKIINWCTHTHTNTDTHTQIHTPKSMHHKIYQRDSYTYTKIHTHMFLFYLPHTHGCASGKKPNEPTDKNQWSQRQTWRKKNTQIVGERATVNTQMDRKKRSTNITHEYTCMHKHVHTKNTHTLELPMPPIHPFPHPSHHTSQKVL